LIGNVLEFVLGFYGKKVSEKWVLSRRNSRYNHEINTWFGYKYFKKLLKKNKKRGEAVHE
jgi:hypothetical protein